MEKTLRAGPLPPSWLPGGIGRHHQCLYVRKICYMHAGCKAVSWDGNEARATSHQTGVLNQNFDSLFDFTLKCCLEKLYLSF